jgi:hypothetical protein
MPGMTITEGRVASTHCLLVQCVSVGCAVLVVYRLQMLGISVGVATAVKVGQYRDCL